MFGKPGSRPASVVSTNEGTWARDGGFTLLELLVTIGLIVFVAVMGVSTLFGSESWEARTRLKAATNGLFMSMQKARSSAVKESKKWAIVFETGHPNRYHICSDSGDGNWSTLADNTVVETIDLTAYGHGIGFGAGLATKSATSPPGAFPSGFDFVSFNNNLVIFHPTGFPAASGYCYLSNDHSETYVVGAMTSGVIRVKNWNGSAWQ